MIERTVQRAQIYYFLSHALLYPQENWLEDMPWLFRSLRDQEVPICESNFPAVDLTLEVLQAQHRDVFGLTGSLLYETELGLPHEFRQSQELADIAGFYRAFGFRIGGTVRERPDYLATELEFMYLLTLKEAYAAQNSMPDQVEICADAQRKFLQDHLAVWVGPFCRSLERSTSERLGEEGMQSPYIMLSRLIEDFLKVEAVRSGARAIEQPAGELQPTPFNPDYTCAGCPVVELKP